MTPGIRSFILLVIGIPVGLCVLALVIFWSWSELLYFGKAPERQDLSGLQSEIHSGLSRKEVYSIIQEHHRTEQDRNASDASGRRLPYPDAIVSYEVGSQNPGCGGEVDFVIKFDGHDRVKSSYVTPLKEDCM